LLEAIVEDPDRHLSELSLLTDAERQQVLVGCSDIHQGYIPELSIHQLFEAQVERTPDSIALVFEDEQLSYRELNDRANRLAHSLRKLNVGPEVPVGVCLERSLEVVVSLLAILKAGGVYLPLDPAYPKQRIGFMLEDSRAPVLLTQTAWFKACRNIAREWSVWIQTRRRSPGRVRETPRAQSSPITSPT